MRYFTSVFTDEDCSIVPPSLPVTGELKLQTISITEDIVKDKLMKLRPSSSPGPDNLHPRVLKEGADFLARPLAILYSKSLETSCLPRDWPLGTIVPIFKKGNRQLPKNYRPVSLTAIPCKILESIIKDKLMEHLTAGDFLTLLVAGSWLPLLVARGGCLGPPLEISGSNQSIFKIQTAFVSPQHDLHFLKKKF